MRDVPSFPHAALILLVLLATSSLALNDAARAQQIPRQGMLLVTGWPDEETKRTGRFNILPFIDTLSVAYRYREIDDAPDLSIVLEWIAGTEAIYDGARVSSTAIDGIPALVGLELSADVVSEGAHVADFSLIVDSMVVEAAPDLIRIDLPTLEWDNVFVDTPGDVARSIFRAGFELRNATIIGAAFAVFDEGRQIAETAVRKRADKDGRRPPHVGPRQPRNVSIYRHPRHLDISFDLFWLIGSRHRPVRISDDGPRENVGRGSLGTAGRSRSGRSGGDVDRSRGGSSAAGIADRGSIDRSRRARTEGTRTDGTRHGGNRTGGSRTDGTGTGGSRTDGTGTGGSRTDGTGTDGTRADRTRADRTHTGGTRAEGTRAEGASPDGAHADGAGAVAGEKDEGKEATRKREGRSTSTIPRRSSSDDDDDDDDDDSKLVPYAIAAVAAAGVLAAVGGTVGYYGNTRYAPLGVTSGIVRNNGGLLLQVAVNEALIGGEGGPKRLMGRMLSFGNLLGTESIQPAVGAGVMATSRGGEIEYEPSLSVGGMARHQMILFYAGYDVLQGSPEFSLAVDLRRIGLWRTSRE